MLQNNNVTITIINNKGYKFILSKELSFKKYFYKNIFLALKKIHIFPTSLSIVS
jgi:hypothetical protein